ncbi:MAG TPA: DUF503 domain-containing protein [Anaerolineales bacterium]|nr:DUF503 domain-containing protein [Anaerolineales bacterium]
MPIGILTLHIHIPGCMSLKEKRSRLKPLLARLHREFNISVAEIDQNDQWKEAVIACVVVSNQSRHTEQYLRRVERWIETSWPDVLLHDNQLEII